MLTADTPAAPVRSTLLIAALAALAACEAPRPKKAAPTRHGHRASAADLAPRRAAIPDRVAAATVPTPRDEAVALQRRLRQPMIKARFSPDGGGDYLSVVKLMRSVTGLPLMVDPEARSAIADEDLSLEFDIRAPMSAAQLLDLMVDRSDALGWTVRNGVVMLTSRAKARGNTVLVTYDVRELTFAVTEFLPPVIGGLPTGNDVAPRFGGEGDERVSRLEPDALVSNLKMAVRPSYWDEEGGGSIEYVDSGYLLVKASRAAHRDVGRFLRDLGM